MSTSITERIEFCKEIRPVKLVPSAESPHLDRVMPRRTCMLFTLETVGGKILDAEGCPVLVAANYESWQRQVVITGIHKRLHRMYIGIQLLTPSIDPFEMIQPGWYGYKLHIPSCLPLQLYSNGHFKIHKSNFE